MKDRLILFINLALIIFIFLSCKKTNVTEPVTDNSLTGIWQETFEWIDPTMHCYTEGGISADSSAIKTTTLIINSNTFSAKILPPHRVLFSQQGTIGTVNSSDTSYSGIFQILGDTLFLQASNVGESFLFYHNGDTLKLQVALKKESDGSLSIPSYSFLWAHSRSKIAGNFRNVH